MAQRRTELDRASEAMRAMKLQLTRHAASYPAGAEAGLAAGLAGVSLASAASAAHIGTQQLFASHAPVLESRRYVCPAPQLRPQYLPAPQPGGAPPPPPVACPPATPAPATAPAAAPPGEAAPPPPAPPPAPPTRLPAGGDASLLDTWQRACEATARETRARHDDILAKLRAPPPAPPPAAATDKENKRLGVNRAPPPSTSAAARHSAGSARPSYGFPGLAPIETPFPSGATTPIPRRAASGGRFQVRPRL